MSKELIDKIFKASAIINDNSRRGYGDYIVTSAHIADILQNEISNLKRRHRKEKIMRIFNEEVQS